ncbi:hypothetical protein B296_00008440 [Ensete ventricosum]|uniref:Uncharacterized protein n=1 Tax=Ensete ventricosum TaxID=4639 RepID=A0A427AQ16_ENSVE|nr:hypothetical protein B296_00008440 [Ensete ventricosum]
MRRVRNERHHKESLPQGVSPLPSTVWTSAREELTRVSSSDEPRSKRMGIYEFLKVRTSHPLDEVSSFYSQ